MQSDANFVANIERALPNNLQRANEHFISCCWNLIACVTRTVQPTLFFLCRSFEDLNELMYCNGSIFFLLVIF